VSKKHPVKSTQSSARNTAPATAAATATPARPGDLEARTRPAAQAGNGNGNGNGSGNRASAGNGNGNGNARDASEAGNGRSGDSPDMSPEARAQMIAEAAYYLSEQRGFAPGHEVEDWLAAEQQIDSRIEGGRGVLGPMQIS
jgi:hypothetical protein